VYTLSYFEFEYLSSYLSAHFSDFHSTLLRSDKGLPTLFKRVLGNPRFTSTTRKRGIALAVFKKIQKNRKVVV
jgi:hypothetical protein